MTASKTLPRSDNTARPVRAGVLIDHPVQHFSRGFQLLRRHPEIEARVYYWDAATSGLFDADFGRHIQWNADLHSGYDWWSPAAKDSGLRRRLAVVRQLSQDRPEALLCYGWGTPIARLGICFAAATRTPLLYYGDTIWRYSASGRRVRLRKRILRSLFHRAAGAISTGTFNREFYIANGLDPERIHPGVCPADTDAFSAAAETRSGGSDRPFVIGFAGKFVAIKAVDDLIEAAALLPRDRSWELWLIGDGPLRPQFESLVEERRLKERVRFLGFKNTDELPALMGAVDVMVTPSRQDNRGLAAVEAMAAGATVIVSTATGLWGPGDLVQNEETGLVYPTGDLDALTKCLRRLMDDPELREHLAAAGRARALSFGPENFAATTAAALVSTARRYQGGRPR